MMSKGIKTINPMSIDMPNTQPKMPENNDHNAIKTTAITNNLIILLRFIV